MTRKASGVIARFAFYGQLSMQDQQDPEAVPLGLRRGAVGRQGDVFSQLTRASTGW